MTEKQHMVEVVVHKVLVVRPLGACQGRHYKEAPLVLIPMEEVVAVDIGAVLVADTAKATQWVAVAGVAATLTLRFLKLLHYTPEWAQLPATPLILCAGPRVMLVQLLPLGPLVK
jgi:hypothetical protein